MADLVARDQVVRLRAACFVPPFLRRTAEQDEYLERAGTLGFNAVVEGICDIVRATSAHQKYHHLVWALVGLGLVCVPDDLANYVYPQPQSAWVSVCGESARPSTTLPRGIACFQVVPGGLEREAGN